MKPYWKKNPHVIALKLRFNIQGWVALGLIIFFTPFMLTGVMSVWPSLIGIAIGTVLWPFVFYAMWDRPVIHEIERILDGKDKDQ